MLAREGEKGMQGTSKAHPAAHDMVSYAKLLPYSNVSVGAAAPRIELPFRCTSCGESTYSVLTDITSSSRGYYVRLHAVGDLFDLMSHSIPRDLESGV